MDNNRGTRSIGEILLALTIAILFLVILLLVVFTASSYQHGASCQTQNENERVVCSYVATSVKNNHGGDVTPMTWGGAPGIRIEDGSTGFAHKIFMKDGDLLEEYSKTDDHVNFETANKIGETSIFEISYIDEDLLEIKTDKGASYVYVQK